MKLQKCPLYKESNSKRRTQSKTEAKEQITCSSRNDNKEDGRQGKIKVTVIAWQIPPDGHA